MIAMRTTIAIILMFLAGYIVMMNWGCVIVSMLNKRRRIDRHHSTVPLISFLLTAVAFEVYPFMPKGWIGIIPAVDIGNWMLIIGLPCAIATGAFKKGPLNQASDATAEPAPGADSSSHQG